MSQSFSSATSQIWVYPERDEKALTKIIEEFNIHPVIAQVLCSRGIKSIKQVHCFLYAQLPDLFNPERFPDMDKAVSRVLEALEKKEPILIYGDNDVDGMSAAALLTEVLRFIGATVFYELPVRSMGKDLLIASALEKALENRCRLVITVDCGISAYKEIQHIVEGGVDVIVSDHHEPTTKIPKCVATLNPKLIDSTYPNRELTGVGVAFKLAHAIVNRLTEEKNPIVERIDLKRYLDLVALGTIADMGSLVGENRILVRYGLKQMKKRGRVGLFRLCEIGEVDFSSLSPSEIASKVAPRLNSLGRVAEPFKGVKLLLTKEDKEAQELVKELDLNNYKRQRIEKQISLDIENHFASSPEELERKAIFLSSTKWHPGVIPIVSARLAKQFNRPAVVISVEKGMGKGSIRTIPEFPVLPFLKENEELLLNFGGHDFAAGITIAEENIPLFQEKFLQSVEKVLSTFDVTPKLYLDAKIGFSEIDFDMMESLHLLEPFGHGNPPPLLYAEAVQVWPPKIIGKFHLKLFLEQKNRILEGIAFHMAHRRAELKKKDLNLKIVFTPQVNVFLHKPSLQLYIKDFQIVE